MLDNHRFKITKVYSTSMLNYFYNHYLLNLKEFDFPYVWIDPVELYIDNGNKKAWYWLSKKNAYIKKYIDDKKGLALDILKNGTHWPLFVYRDENERLTVFEGVHRVSSIHIANSMGLWNNREMLCFVMPKGLFYQQYSKDMLEYKEKYIYIPIYNIDNKEFYYRRYKEFLKSFNENKDRFDRSTRDSVIKIKTYNMVNYKRAFNVFPSFLKHAFFKADMKNQNIKNMTIINDKALWFKFKGGCFRI